MTSPLDCSWPNMTRRAFLTQASLALACSGALLADSPTDYVEVSTSCLSLSVTPSIPRRPLSMSASKKERPALTAAAPRPFEMA